MFGISRPGTDQYQRPVVTVDVIIFTLEDNDLRVLLVRRREWPCEGMWAIPEGVVRHDEPLETAALRKLREETGLTEVYLEQLYTFGAVNRDPRDRVIAVAYFAVASVTRIRPSVARDGEGMRLWSMNRLPSLAFDHAEILEYALTRLRYKLEYTAVGFELLPPVFTLSELQSAYEIVLGEELDKRNFRRKILAAGVIEPSGGYRSGEGRPARLYQYRDDAVGEVKARRLFP